MEEVELVDIMPFELAAQKYPTPPREDSFFDNTNGVAQSVKWGEGKLIVFDAPNAQLRSSPYSQRYEFLVNNFNEGSQHNLTNFLSSFL